MNNDIITSLSEEIIKPQFINDLNFNSESKLYLVPNLGDNELGLNFKLTLQCNSGFDLFKILKWFKYKFSKYNNSIKLSNWDDDLLYDFQTDYQTFLYFNIDNVFNFLKNCPDNIISYSYIKDMKDNYSIYLKFRDDIKNINHINYGGEIFQKIELMFNDIIFNFFTLIIRD